MTFLQLISKFPDDNAVIEYYIQARYNGIPACHHCGSISVYHRKDYPKKYQCMDCNNSFSIFKDTIFEDSYTSLVKWMYAIHLMINSKKGISGLQLKRELGVTYKTAWRMLRQIRKAMGNEDLKEFFKGVVEVDETFHGGKPRKGNTGKQKGKTQNKQGQTDKKPIIGIVDRDKKKIYSLVPDPHLKTSKPTSLNILTAIMQYVKPNPDTHVITDQYRGYHILKSEGYNHSFVDHHRFFSHNGIHTNNIEGFWATLKRGLKGIYQCVSVKYLQSYVNEFCFRYNNRNNDKIFDQLLTQTVMM